MPLPTHTSKSTLDRALQQALGAAGALKNHASSARQEMAAGSVPGSRVRILLDGIKAQVAALNAAKAVPGIGAYAQSQLQDQTYDIAADVDAALSAADAVMAWIITNAGAKKLQPSLNGDGSWAEPMFTPTQTEPLQTLLTDLEATIA